MFHGVKNKWDKHTHDVRNFVSTSVSDISQYHSLQHLLVMWKAFAKQP